MDLLTRMETFVRIVEAGTLSAAARQLGLSVAAVSRHVAALEGDIGASLLARTTRKVSVTPVGSAYYERCVRVLREVDDAQAIARMGLTGPLRISMPVSLSVLAGEALVTSLLTEHPTLRVDLRVEDRLVDLALDNIDIAIRIGIEPPLSTEVVAVPVASWTSVVVASPAYVSKRGVPTSPAELAQHDALVVGNVASVAMWKLVDGTQAVQARLTPRLSTNAGHLLRDAALQGRGIALLPDWFVAPDLQAGRLQRLLSPWTSSKTLVHALYRTSLRGEPRVRAVIEHMRAAFEGGEWTRPQRAEPSAVHKRDSARSVARPRPKQGTGH